MSTSGSIILGAALIGACILSNIGYEVRNDHFREAAERAAAIEHAEASRVSQGIAAWREAAAEVHGEFHSWAKDHGHRCNYDRREMALLKLYNHGDVKWLSGREIEIRGYIQSDDAAPVSQWHQWKKVFFLTDAGDWANPSGSVTFEPATLSEEQRAGWLFSIRSTNR